MTSSMEVAMPENQAPQSGLRRALTMIVVTLGLIMSIGAIAGFIVGHEEAGGGPFKPVAVAVLVVLAAIMVASGYVLWRGLKRSFSADRSIARRDKLNRNVMIAACVLGGLTGALLVAALEFGESDGSVFSDSPIPQFAAIGLAILFGVVGPALTWYWHQRVVDEQEADAYRIGALFGMYTFWLAAPVWWLLWRGGMLPAPDGITLYMATIIVASGVWFWKKYR